MAVYSVGPVAFDTPSMTTATPGRNDAQLGTRIQYEGNEYVFVYNDGNSRIPVGYGAVLQSGASGYSVTVSAATSADLMVGACKFASINTGYYGWLLTKGFGTVQMLASSGSVASRGLLELGANGLFAPVSNTTGNAAPAVGQALAAIVSGASGSAFISVF
jgi:hypothetical protein